MRQLRRALAIALILTVLVVGITMAAHQISSAVTVDGDTTATYVVTSDGSPAISHVVIPGCAEIEPVVTGCPGAVIYGADPTTGVTGYKCDAGGSYTLTIVWPGELTTETQDAGIKAGTNVQLVPVEAVACVPQAVVIDRFEIVNGAFEWDSILDGTGYWVEFNDKPVTVWTPAQSPGNWGWFSYHVAPLPTMARSLPYGTYYLWAQDVTAQSGIVAVYWHSQRQPADGPVIWKQHCPAHYDVVQEVAADWGGVHVLCVRAAEEVTPDNND